VLIGKSVGILSSPLLEQSTLTPFELLVQLQTLGHDDTTPTNKITATIAVIRNCILRSQSTNTKYIYLIVIVQCHHINKMKKKKEYHTEEIYYMIVV
jgi:hypothetical protein